MPGREGKASQRRGHLNKGAVHACRQKCVSGRKNRDPEMKWHSIYSRNPEHLSKARAQGKWWGMREGRRQGSDSGELGRTRLMNLDLSNRT